MPATRPGPQYPSIKTPAERLLSRWFLRIQRVMHRLLPILLLTIFTGSAFAQSRAHSYEGVFQGQIVTAKKPRQGWLYVLSKNGYLRQVEVKRAEVEYDDDFPARDRRTHPVDSLRPPAVIRVTANQDAEGQWHASHILIVASSQPPRQRNHRSTIASPELARRVKTFVSQAPDPASK
jgi:hypothetical protein